MEGFMEKVAFGLLWDFPLLLERQIVKCSSEDGKKIEQPQHEQR